MFCVIVDSLTGVDSSDYTLCVRGVAQLAAHRVWDAGAGGSSPPTPTNHLILLAFANHHSGSPIEG